MRKKQSGISTVGIVFVAAVVLTGLAAVGAFGVVWYAWRGGAAASAVTHEKAMETPQVMHITDQEAQMDMVLDSTSGAETRIPGWAPKYRGLQQEGQVTVMRRPDGISGSAHFQTPDSMERVGQFYEAEMRRHGFRVSVSRISFPVKQVVIVGEVGRDERGLAVTLRRQGEATTVGVSFNERSKG